MRLIFAVAYNHENFLTEKISQYMVGVIAANTSPHSDLAFSLLFVDVFDISQYRAKHNIAAAHMMVLCTS